MFFFWPTRWGRALFDIETDDFLFSFSGGGTRGLVEGTYLEMAPQGLAWVHHLSHRGRPPQLLVYTSTTWHRTHFPNTHTNWLRLPRGTHSISTSVCVSSSRIRGTLTSQVRQTDPTTRRSKSTHDIIRFHTVHTRKTTRHTRIPTKPNQANLDKFTHKRDPARYPYLSTQPRLVVNQPQLLPHIPPPRLDSRALRRLGLAVLKRLAARLERLQKHAGVKEAICPNKQPG